MSRLASDRLTVNTGGVPKGVDEILVGKAGRCCRMSRRSRGRV